MFKFLNMAAISIRTFMYHQQYYLHPAILQVWKNHQGAYIEEVQETGRAVRLGGDGRADTPGHCAMFGSYTLMYLEENKVVDMQLVQVFFPCEIMFCYIISLFAAFQVMWLLIRFNFGKNIEKIVFKWYM